MSLEEARRRIQEAYDTRATVLDLSGCDIDELPPEMQQLTWLEELRVDSDEMWEKEGYSPKKGRLNILPSWIGVLNCLKILKVRGQQLQILPHELFTLTQLRILKLRGNMLLELPSDVRYLTRLHILGISSNHLVELPPELRYLTELQELDVTGNQLTALPSELQYLTKLQELYASNNEIVELPSELFKLVRLRALTLNFNQINIIPSLIENLVRLRILNLGNNQIEILPSQLFRLKELQRLYIYLNPIKSSLDDIKLLRNLRDLSIANIGLVMLPLGLFSLKRLEFLDVGNNKLTSLPSELGMLTHLEHLDMRGNHLTELPPELQRFWRLQYLGTSNNPLTIPSELTLDTSPKRVFSYLRQLGEGESRPLMEAKVILVGEGTVGKTSLVKRLMHDQYNPAECKTEGIAIERWPLQLDDGEVRLNVWDFGGQEIMHATHQFFLTRRSVYLLALNCRASDHDNRLDYWLKLVQSFAPDSPVIVVGNKADQHALDLDQRGLMLKYPQIKAFVATSCATGAGIAELRAEIARQLAGLKHLRDVLPLSWWSVKRQLENMHRDYISHERFQELCEQHGIDDPFVQTVLLGLLNDLGTVLSYHDDPRLAETNVLNPEWVTNGVYTLLNHAPLLNQRSGMLGAGELTAILGKYGDRYPATKCHFISDMMEKFELCFRIERDQWLIPDLLPREEPDSGGWEEALHFVFRYPVLPGSIISRFIVRFQHAIVGDLRWRTGVVLRSGENRALVKADPEDARIDIRIDGDLANRRRFLSAIRHTFEQIHASLAGLRPEIKEFVPLPGYPDEMVNYQELLGLEEMGARDYQSGLLRRIFPLAQLLDGYESATERQARQVKNYDEDPLEHLQALLEINEGQRRELELQKARSGMHVPPYILGEINRLSGEIERIREAMERRRLRGGR